jgi:hypothetical protein
MGVVERAASLILITMERKKIVFFSPHRSSYGSRTFVLKILYPRNPSEKSPKKNKNFQFKLKRGGDF